MPNRNKGKAEPEVEELDEGELPQEEEEIDEPGTISIEDFLNADETIPTNGSTAALTFLREHEKAYNITELMKVVGKSRQRTLGILKEMKEKGKITGKKINNSWFFHAQLDRA